MDEKEIARYFDCCETEKGRAWNTKISRKARAALIQGVSADIQGKTVLEVGCGPGDLLRELVRSGASRATGVDLAEDTIEEARERNKEEGLADRIDLKVGNGAKDLLDGHDIVVLDKVICCYPDWMALVDNTTAAAGSTFGLVLPRSDGISSTFVRAFMVMSNVFLRIGKCGLRVFVHDFRAIDEAIIRKGFRRTLLSRGRIWTAAVYGRLGVPG